MSPFSYFFEKITEEVIRLYDILSDNHQIM
jgi:hypothetical protein